MPLARKTYQLPAHQIAVAAVLGIAENTLEDVIADHSEELGAVSDGVNLPGL